MMVMTARLIRTFFLALLVFDASTRIVQPTKIEAAGGDDIAAETTTTVAAAAAAAAAVNDDQDQDPVSATTSTTKTSNNEEQRELDSRPTGSGGSVLIYSTGGQGLRSMTASMGFANIFSQILYGQRRDRDRDRKQRNLRKLDRLGGGTIGNQEQLWLSDFYAVAANAEASWFAVQFFFSEEFRTRTVQVSPTALYNFVSDWMNSYLAINSELPKADTCQLFETFSESYQTGRSRRQACDLIFAKYNGDWALFVQDVFRNASATAYNDPGFENRIAEPNAKGWTLDQVHLFLQSTIVPVSQVRGLNQLSNIAPNGGSGQNSDVYAVGIPTQYSVKDTFTTYYMAALDQSQPIRNSNGAAPSVLSPNTFDNYYTYQGFQSSGSILTYPTSGISDRQPFAEPFGGGPATVTQAAAISSAYLGVWSGTAPSALSQYVSSLSFYQGSEETQFLYDMAASSYIDATYDDLAICSQWPYPCGNSDARFIAGSNSDGFSLASTIGQYHQEGNNPSNSVIKIVLTNNGYYTWNDVRFLEYFSTDFNANINPGDFLWAPSEDPASTNPAQEIPCRSPQIFQDYLSSFNIQASMNSVSNTNFTYGEFQGTTIQNSAYGVKAGQTVKILYIRINSGIPTDILGRKQTNDNMNALASLARDIAANDELKGAIENFWQEEDVHPAYCLYSPDYTCYRYGWPDCCFYYPNTCPSQQPACDGTGTSYCTYAPDYNCYVGGWPQCCLTNPSSCPSQQPACDVIPNSYCSWAPDYQCYTNGWPQCCSSSNPSSCPQQQPPCEYVGTGYCTASPDYDCYYEGWPSCCFDPNPTCPRDKPSCEVN